MRLCLLSLAALMGLANFALGSAPLQRKQAPGFHRAMIGDIEVTVLSDGTFKAPMRDLLLGMEKKEIDTHLEKYHLTTPTLTSLNGFLINTGKKLVLIDTGAGGFFGPTVGKMTDSLKAAGYKPEEVDEIYITHFHADHIGGLMREKKRTYPQAILRADQNDIDYWLSDDQMAKASEGKKAHFKAAHSVIKPYIEAKKFKAFNGKTELVKGITAHPTYGHTPGHTIYEVSSQGHTLMLWGDLIHVAAVQFKHPKVAIQFDSDPSKAINQRLKAFSQAAKSRFMVGAAHLSFPGLGHLNSADQGFEFIPLNYHSLPSDKSQASH